MSCDSYYRHKVIAKVGSQRSSQAPAGFEDDRELLAYLLDQERQVELKQKQSQKQGCPA